MDYEKVVLITRKTRLQGLVDRFNTVGQARFYIEHSGGNFALYKQEHDTYHNAVDALRNGLHKVSKVQEIERGFLPNFLFTPADIVVTIGIDGLVANTAKYLDGQPLVAVNPDPANIDGILLPFTVEQAFAAVDAVLQDQAQVQLISMAEARLNDGESMLAFNDLFIGVKSHVSARYTILSGNQSERQSSSGIIVSTGVGRTGWLSSLLNMANGLFRGFEPNATPERAKLPLVNLDWAAQQLVFVVREPFVSKTSSADLVSGFISPEEPLVLVSEMPEGGVIFSDGIEADFLSFNAGTTATINLSDRQTHLVVGSIR